MSIPDELGLLARDGLPAHLRVLADRYPRERWEAHNNFNNLTQFWLGRHLMFRQAHAQLRDQTQGFLDRRSDTRAYLTQVSRIGGFLINELHTHHGIEDAHYFPLLAANDPSLEAAFALLDSDHHDMDQLLASLTTSANALLQGGGKPRQADAFLTAVTDFGGFLDRHLVDEEEIVVPVILEYGSAGLG